jgi:hypothetical protein
MKVLMEKSDAQLLADIRGKSTRHVLAEFMRAVSQLAVHLELPDLAAVSVNFHGAAMRVDVATLTDDGQHLDHWLLGLNADVTDPQFGARLTLPGMDGQSH